MTQHERRMDLRDRQAGREQAMMRRVQLARIVALEGRGDRTPLVDRLAAEYIGAAETGLGELPISVLERLALQGRAVQIFDLVRERFAVNELGGAFIRCTDWKWSGGGRLDLGDVLVAVDGRRIGTCSSFTLGELFTTVLGSRAAETITVLRGHDPITVRL